MPKKLFLALLINGVVLAPAAWAHYLWVAIDASNGPLGTTNVYFEESPAAGDGHYLDPFLKSGKTWIRTVQDPAPQLLQTKEVTQPKKRWLSSRLPQAGPRSIDSIGKFGVYRYGKTDVLLHYYARCLDVKTHQQLHKLARAKHMRLDIVPHDDKEGLRLTVLWQGAPAVDRPFAIRGPQKLKQNVKTDNQGQVRFKPKGKGRYTFRTSIELQQAGREGDQDYSLIRHHATLVLALPLE